MSLAVEFNRLRTQAGIIPYRRVGKVRMAYSPATPAPTIEAAAKAVKSFAPRLVDEWGEPERAAMLDWQRHGLTFLDVCDDPCPADVDPATVEPGWLLKRCPRWHFTLCLTSEGKVRGQALDGWNMKSIRPLTPGWFVETMKARGDEVAAELKRAVNAMLTDAISQCDKCRAVVFEAVRACGCSDVGCPYIPESMR